MNLNFKKLKQDINSYSNQIKFMRANKKRYMNDVSIDQLKLWVTILCSLRAEHRGKLHRTTVRNPHAGLPEQPKTLPVTHEDQLWLIKNTIPQYETSPNPVI
jgi:hypothetical protein